MRYLAIKALLVEALLAVSLLTDLDWLHTFTAIMGAIVAVPTAIRAWLGVREKLGALRIQKLEEKRKLEEVRRYMETKYKDL